MFLLCFIVLINYYNIEARVLCEDKHATPWMPLGYSCPVNCNSVVAAIKRLKTIEHGELLRNPNNNNETQDDNSIPKNMLRTSYIDQRSNIEHMRKIQKILTNERAARDLNDLFQNKMASDFEYRTCHKMADEKSLLLKKIQGRHDCLRKMATKDDFLKTFTNILNKYTHSEYHFTEEMTETLLEKILGKNMDLRDGVLDVQRIIEYLGDAIKKQNSLVNKETVITLKSKHCLSLHVSGCYCKPGFVENSGQCVTPQQCVSNMQQDARYLARIVIH